MGTLATIEGQLPLADAQFFEQVLIDCGAVAWPGEIDLAPDAMYAQIAGCPRGALRHRSHRPARQRIRARWFRTPHRLESAVMSLLGGWRLSSVWRERLAVLLLSYVLSLALLGLRGAGQGRFTDPDAPAYFTTGLMVRDYLAAGLPGPPLAYAERYYLHYPKVALGHWPPLFPLAAGLWMLPFPPFPASVLLLTTGFAAVTALLIFASLRRDYGTAAALVAAEIFILLPQIQMLTGQVMADMLVALLLFGAALCFGRYLDTGHTASAVWFGVLAALACLTKASGFALVLMPPLAVALTGRFGLLRRFRFWIPAIIVVALCGPWYYFTWPMIRGEHMVGNEPDYWLAAIRAALANAALLRAGQAGILGLALLGLAARRRSGGGKWIAAALLPLAVWLFHSLLSPHTEERLTTLAIPAVCLFVGAGWSWVRRCLPDSPFWGWALSLAVLASSLAWTAPRQPEDAGYGRLASQLLAAGSSRDSVILVSGTSLTEGSAIVEIAVREFRPGHIVLRASKQFSISDWMGRQYRLRYDTPDQIQAYLESIPVRLVVAQSLPAQTGPPHHRLLRETLARYRDRWERIPAGEGFDLYRLIGPGRGPGSKIRIDMPGTLGRPIRQD
jgi:4-amino-4-deoxy-L-arabinose transferase-like glycosyltransferase